MASIRELRERRSRTAEMREERVKRVSDAVRAVVDSDGFTLTTLEHMGEAAEPNEAVMSTFANKVANEIVSVVTDPKLEFIDTCKSRGFTESRIRKTVELLVSTFCIEHEGDTYEDKLEAAALFMADNPGMYDTVVWFR